MLWRYLWTTPKPEYRPFDPASASIQEYDDQAYQDIYYIAESFEDMMEKFRYATKNFSMILAGSLDPDWENWDKLKELLEF